MSTTYAPAAERKISDNFFTKEDRCDADCPAAAQVLVEGANGQLFFCGHHYNRIMHDPVGKERMLAFAFETIDQRELN